MERQTAERQDSPMVYGKDETFDVEVGMAVTGPDGHKIGTVAEVAGFGATHVRETAHPETGASVTQAGSGTGYITVDRRDVVGRRDAAPLCVPFHGIAQVTAEQGVVLNGTIITELHDQAASVVHAAAAVSPTSPGRWHRWRVGRSSSSNRDATVGQRETDDLRAEMETREEHRDGETGLDTVNLRGHHRGQDTAFSLGGSVQDASGFDEEMRP